MDTLGKQNWKTRRTISKLRKQFRTTRGYKSENISKTPKTAATILENKRQLK